MVSKTALITGCGPGGIGSALVKALHRRGHRVFATGRTTQEIDPELEKLGVETFVLDVTSEESIQNAVRVVRQRTSGRLDILVNNAGMLQSMPFADMPVSDFRRLYEVNVISVWAATQAFLPLLLESRGLVVGMCSISSVFCPPFIAGYASSKAAVEAMLRSMRRELSPLGVRVLIVKAGSVSTGLFNQIRSVLPEGSYYAPIREWVESKAGFTDAKHQDVNDFAEDVVDELLRQKTKAVAWKGGLVWVAWVLSWLGWETMLDSSVLKAHHLGKISYSPESQKQK